MSNLKDSSTINITSWNKSKYIYKEPKDSWFGQRIGLNCGWVWKKQDWLLKPDLTTQQPELKSSKWNPKTTIEHQHPLVLIWNL